MAQVKNKTNCCDSVGRLWLEYFLHVLCLTAGSNFWWMAKILYSIRVLMFKEQFLLTDQKKCQLETSTCFLVWYAQKHDVLSKPDNNTIQRPSNSEVYLQVQSVQKQIVSFLQQPPKLFLRICNNHVCEELAALAFWDTAINHGACPLV